MNTQKQLDDYEVVIKLISKVLNLDVEVLELATTRNDLPAWDSLATANIFFSLEEYFEVQFDVRKMMKCESIGDICNLLESVVACPD